MKNIFTYIVWVTIVISCNLVKTDNSENPTDNIIGQKSDTINRTVKLFLESTELRLSKLPDAIKVMMINNTNDTITTGDYFLIEKFEGNKWVGFTPKDIMFYSIGYNLKPNDTKIFNEKLFKNQIDYKSGKYRIVKQYLKPDYQQTNEKFNTYAEFEIN